MGRESRMVIAIQTLRQNRALLKKRKIKTIKDFIYESSPKTKLEFKQVSSQDLFILKRKIQNRHKRNAKIEIALLIGSFLLVLTVFYGLYIWAVG